ncbi:MAG: hypothetical protein LBD20_03340 [Spirochaetaceae bacterium]|jgi:hypothetical protein|nr:hypothetical protein [Spirochaetaceae bacterium]
MFKKTGVYALVCVCIVFFACNSPLTPNKRGSGGSDTNGKAEIPEDEDEFYPDEGITVRVTLMYGENVKNVDVEEGRALIGSQGFAGLPADTVWIEQLSGTPTSPEDINTQPLKPNQVFVPWIPQLLPDGWTTIKIIASPADFATKIRPDCSNGASANIIYVMSRDIDGAGSWINNMPGISVDTPFQGWFNGGGYTIKNLKLYSGALSSLFGCVDGAYIENVRVTLAKTEELKAADDIYISPIVSRVVGPSPDGAPTTLKRIAVSMDKNQGSIISIGSPVTSADVNEQTKVFFGGIAASLESAAPVYIEECAVFVNVSANTELAMSNSKDARVSIGGLVGDISGKGLVTIRNNYTLGSAAATGEAPKTTSSYFYNYPKYIGGLVGFFADGPSSQSSPSMIYHNYVQFDCEVGGGTGFDTLKANELYRAASGLVGAKGGSRDAYLSIFSNFVMTEQISVNDKYGTDYRTKRIVYLSNQDGNTMPKTTLRDTDAHNESYSNFVNQNMVLHYNAVEPPIPAGLSVPAIYEDIKSILNGENLEAKVFAEEPNYRLIWDFEKVWVMGFKRQVNYNMVTGKGIKTSSGQHYGGYPYPTLQWLGSKLPVPTYNFKPIAYPAYDAEGNDAEGFDRNGFHKETKLNREGYDKWGIYGGIENGFEYYTYETKEAKLANMTVPAPGFGWSSPDYYKPGIGATMVRGDWKLYNPNQPGGGNPSVLTNIAVPKDSGHVTDPSYAYAPAKGLPCPWVDPDNDGYHDLLELDSRGFGRPAEGGYNAYGYDERGVHLEGYENGGQADNQQHSTGFDIYGFPCPWIDEDNDQYNDITGLNENWQIKPEE